jgi:hypothetical protein
MRRCLTFAILVVAVAAPSLPAQDPELGQDQELVVTTWNIEHLGSPGRGFGGGFGGQHELPPRTDAQLKRLAELIHGELKSDVMALQEIAITRRRLDASFSTPLDKIVAELKTLGQTWNYYLPPTDVTPAADDIHNLFLAFLWNAKRARLLTAFEIDLQNQELIDHILINDSAKQDVVQDKADVFRFDGGTDDPAKLTEWRINYSDHFPLSFRLTIRADDDADFFQ